MSDSGPQITFCCETRVHAALDLVLRRLPTNQRGPLVDALSRLRGEPLAPFAGLVTATQGARVVGAAWAQPQAGRTASLWPPELVGTRSTEVSQQLINKALAACDAAGVTMCQALLEPDEKSAAEDLIACGFHHLTTMRFLGWSPAGGESSEAQRSTDVELQHADTLDRRELEALVAETYRETLDCPELDGLRPVADVLDGYEQTGDYDPGLWFVLRQGEAAVGVLLLNEHRASKQMELTYMGVTPSARGRGVGHAAVRAAQSAASKRKVEQLVLAVDDRNAPAIAVYTEAGFTAWAQRSVLVRPLPQHHREG